MSHSSLPSRDARPPGGTGGRLRAVLIAACVALAAPSALGAAHPYERWAEQLGIDLNVSYDGVRVMEFRDGTFEVTERRAPGKMYTEIHMGNMVGGVILREDLGKSFMLMPSMGFYREDSLEGGLMQASNGLEFSEIASVGRESINGHPSTKYKARFSDKEGKGAGFVWVTDTGVPIRLEMIYSTRGAKGERLTSEFSELNLRPQDPAHFEVPDNLKPMKMGMGLGQLLQQQGTAPSGAADPATGDQDDLAAAQQRCLQQAVESSRDQQKTKRGFGRLLGAAARATGRFGGGDTAHDLAQISADVYAVDATARDIQGAAEDLGITEDAVERCRNP